MDYHYYTHDYPPVRTHTLTLHLAEDDVLAGVLCWICILFAFLRLTFHVFVLFSVAAYILMSLGIRTLPICMCSRDRALIWFSTHRASKQRNE